MDFGKIFEKGLSGGLESGISGLIGGALGSLFGSDDVKKTYKYQKKLAAYQSQLQREAWFEQFNAQNAYNTPLMQRQRLEMAGYNPALMYGLPNFGNNSMGAAAAAPSGQLSETFSEARAKQTQSMAAFSQASTAAREAESRIKLNESAAENQIAQAEEARGKESRAKEQHPRQMQLLDLQIAIGKSDKIIRDIEAKYKEQATKNEIAIQEKTLDVMAEQITHMKEQDRLREAELEQTKWYNKEQIRVSNISAAAAMVAARASQTQAAASVMQARASLQNANTQAQVAKAQIRYYNALSNTEKWSAAIRKQDYIRLTQENKLMYDPRQGYSFKLPISSQDFNKVKQLVDPKYWKFLSTKNGRVWLNVSNAQMALVNARDKEQFCNYLIQKQGLLTGNQEHYYEAENLMKLMNSVLPTAVFKIP